MEDKLLPCPICRSEAHSYIEYDTDNGADNYGLGCSNKECLLYKWQKDWCACHSSKSVMRDLIMRWNAATPCKDDHIPDVTKMAEPDHMEDMRDMVSNWPNNICADRHEITKKWVLHYLTDEQAALCKQALTKKDG